MLHAPSTRPCPAPAGVSVSLPPWPSRHAPPLTSSEFPRKDRYLCAFYSALLVVGLLGPVHSAWACRPLATEDADVLERGSCERESFGLRVKPQGLNTTRGVSTQVGCGVGEATQIALAGTRSRGGEDTLGAWTVGGKTETVARDHGTLGVISGRYPATQGDDARLQVGVLKKEQRLVVLALNARAHSPGAAQKPYWVNTSAPAGTLNWKWSAGKTTAERHSVKLSSERCPKLSTISRAAKSLPRKPTVRN